MDKSSARYMPVLKWRQGEYQALFRLRSTVKDNIVPLVIIPPLEYDFEAKKMKKTVHDHVEPFPKRFSKKWGDRSAFVDFDESLYDEFMNTGASVVSYVFDEMSNLKHSPVPVTGISRSKNYQAVIKSAHKIIKSGLALRLKLEELMHPDVSENISALVKYHKLHYGDVDLIIDLEAPKSFEPYGDFAKALANRIKSINEIEAFRTFVIVATSISVSSVKTPGANIPRHEWNLYKAFTSELGNVRIPSFGDYCIELPNFTALDMRFVNAAGKIIYTTEEFWYIRKGNAFRGNEIQMVQHCKDVIASDFYKGKEYSWGDEVIDNTANELDCSKSRTIWKQVGFSHHITLVAEQFSILHDT